MEFSALGKAAAVYKIKTLVFVFKLDSKKENPPICTFLLNVFHAFIPLKSHTAMLSKFFYYASLNLNVVKLSYSMLVSHICVYVLPYAE